MAERETKVCTRCGRVITWRAKWAKNWSSIKYCSDACRAKRIQPVDTALEAAIIDLLSIRPRDASICPSEAARRIRTDDWRTLMEPARMAARRLVERGTVEITQGGRVVDPSHAKGPIRIRLVRS